MNNDYSNGIKNINDFNNMLLKLFSMRENQTPEPEKNGKDNETAYEKIWNRFKQIEANDKALKMSPIKKNHCHCDEKDTEEYLEENNIEKQKMNADMFNSFPATPKPPKQPKTPEQNQQEWDANTKGVNKPVVPKQPTPTKQPSYRDILTGKTSRTV